MAFPQQSSPGDQRNRQPDHPSVEELIIDQGPAAQNFADIDVQERLQGIRARYYKLETLLETWKQDQKAERWLRGGYAVALLLILLLELGFVATFAVYIGVGKFNVSPWIANGFILGALGQIITMVNMVMKYLFPAQSTKLLDMIDKL